MIVKFIFVCLSTSCKFPEVASESGSTAARLMITGGGASSVSLLTIMTAAPLHNYISAS